MVAVRGLCIGLALVAACQSEKPQPFKATPVATVAPATTTGIAACDDYLRRVAACTKLAPAMRETLALGGGIWKQAADQGGPAAKGALDRCTAVARLAASSLAELGC